MSKIILVHGAQHGGWAWERTMPLLEAAGHDVLAPDLPGMGGDQTPFAEDTLGQWVDAIAGLAYAQGEPVILVGHSLSGIVVCAVAERVPDHVALVVLLAAVVLPDGRSALEAEVFSEALVAGIVPNAAGDAGSVLPETAREVFYGELEPGVADGAVVRLVEQPFQTVSAPVRLTPARFGKVPRAYIETERDRAILIGKQREMRRLWPSDDVVTLPSGHSPFFEMPEVLAEALNTLARKYAG